MFVEQLLQITIVPIKIDMETIPFRMEQKREAPTVNISRKKGGLNIETHPTQLHLDSTAMRESIGIKTWGQLAQDHGQEGLQSCRETAERYSQEGRQLLDGASSGIKPADLARKKLVKTMNYVMSLIPSKPTDISWTDGSIDMQYQPDELTFDWETNEKVHFEFVPGDVKFTVTQRPEVRVEYVGEPIYFPPSSNPNYKNELNETI